MNQNFNKIIFNNLTIMFKNPIMKSTNTFISCYYVLIGSHIIYINNKKY